MDQFQVFYGIYLKEQISYLYHGLACLCVVIRWMLKDLETKYAKITTFHTFTFACYHNHWSTNGSLTASTPARIAVRRSQHQNDNTTTTNDKPRTRRPVSFSRNSSPISLPMLLLLSNRSRLILLDLFPSTTQLHHLIRYPPSKSPLTQPRRKV